MRKYINLLLALLPFLLFISRGQSQDYRIRNYSVREGICHPFVYTINQDAKGYIWVGTGEGLCRFNGVEFSSDIITDSTAREVAGTSFKDSRGMLWFGYYSGHITKYDGIKFETVHCGLDIKSAITGFTQPDQQLMLISTLNEGLIRLNVSSGECKKVEGIEEGLITAIYAGEEIMLLGSPDGLALYELKNMDGSANLIVRIRELDFIKIQDIRQSNDNKGFWIATEDMGFYYLTINGSQYKLINSGEKFRLGRENVQSVIEDSQDQLWLSTLHNGVYKLSAADGNGGFSRVVSYNKQNGLPGNAIKNVFEDLEGNIWIATYGDGLSLLTGQAFTFTSFANPGLDDDIQAITALKDETLFIGGNGGLFRALKNNRNLAQKVNSIPVNRITALCVHDNNLLVGTDKNGLFLLNINTLSARQIPYLANSLGNSISSIVCDSARVYLGTGDGIYVMNQDYHLLAHYTTFEGLPHNNVESVFIDSKGRLLLATRSNGIYQVTRTGEIKNLYPARDSDIKFRSLTEDASGAIWAGTDGDGVYCFRNDSVYHFNTETGLKTNYCYSILAGKDKSVWIGHRLGISRINTSTLKISIYDMNIGMTGDCNQNAIYLEDSGKLLVGTTEGLVTYDPAKDRRKKIPPFTNITRLLISDKPYDFNKDIVLPYKLYKIRFEFIGLNYSDPQSVKYQYKLEGHDLGWSDITTQNFASYPRIEDGDYVFYLRAFNREGLSQEVPMSVKIRVKLPVWKTWWFISISLVILILAVYTYIKIRERKQKLLQEYLERELAARTKEVVEQKDIIETKNRDITDSINYAKRIQTSMLPPIKRLQQNFSGCFVFYSPRDIVSGDFYWFDKVNNSKFIIVCADSTGHGVPGAFMSMIGSTLIKDICNREMENSPSQILQSLDFELKNTLNQNLEDGTKPGDGMDIIVCEIDLNTHYVRYASAMRPMIIYRNGEEVFIKGSRNSVGGHYEMEENRFEDEGLQLSKGDIIYMFSDGYSDQFGGPMGKKFKMVRLKNLLQDIHQKPMDEQLDHVKNSFNLWKENYEQVDDVLFMGIKI
jgi:ligand-binding sensor domain-containing protein/serine phosphatase RsbU (regulator of sigma subunit)